MIEPAVFSTPAVQREDPSTQIILSLRIYCCYCDSMKLSPPKYFNYFSNKNRFQSAQQHNHLFRFPPFTFSSKSHKRRSQQRVHVCRFPVAVVARLCRFSSRWSSLVAAWPSLPLWCSPWLLFWRCAVLCDLLCLLWLMANNGVWHFDISWSCLTHIGGERDFPSWVM